MLFHQFHDNLVLALELLTQCSDGPLMLAVGGGFLKFKGGGPVLEEQLLPLIEQRESEFVLVTKVGDGNPVDQMTPKDSDLLSRRVVLAGLAHGVDSCRAVL